MKLTILGIAAAAVLASAPSFAQPANTTAPTTGTPTTGTPTTGTTAMPRSNMPSDHPAVTGSTASTNPIPPGAPGNRTGQQAASGDTNQAVATTSMNSAQPAHGANSFTMAQAKSRMEKEGFSNVMDLRKDDNGIWHAQAQKSGGAAQVWLDYKGNIGEGQKE